jgi:hypothetical protein
MMLAGRLVGVAGALGLPCRKPEPEAGEEPPADAEAELGLVIELKSTSSPSAFFTTILDRPPGTNALEFAFNLALAVDGVGGGDDKPLILFEVEWE